MKKTAGEYEYMTIDIIPIREAKIKYPAMVTYRYYFLDTPKIEKSGWLVDDVIETLDLNSKTWNFVKFEIIADRNALSAELGLHVWVVEPNGDILIKSNRDFNFLVNQCAAKENEKIHERFEYFFDGSQPKYNMILLEQPIYEVEFDSNGTLVKNPEFLDRKFLNSILGD